MTDTALIKKPGYKTTEFYLATLSSIIGIAWASGLVSDGSELDKVLGFAAMILSSLGYNVLRHKAKQL